MEKTLEHLSRTEMKDILCIQSALLKSMHDFMWDEGIIQLMPVMLSPFTDPLAHKVHDNSIEYEGQRLMLTHSMILHKQLSLMREDLKGIYIVSPNVRLEPGERGSSGRHLIEFSQVDIELKDASHKDFMEFMERLYSHMTGFVMGSCSESLERLGRELKPAAIPFKIYDKPSMKEKYGDDWEHKLSMEESQPFWVMDHFREFYDKEDPETGKHVNYDLVYPEGFGEGLSGAERETDYDVILRKMKERETDPEPYAPYLEVARKGILKPTAGGGFGVERLLRYLTGKKTVKEVCLFPRVPGERIVV